MSESEQKEKEVQKKGNKLKDKMEQIEIKDQWEKDRWWELKTEKDWEWVREIHSVRDRMREKQK